MTDKKFKVIMVGYDVKHTRDTYKLYNPETKRIIITRGVKWADCKNTNAAETLKMFCEAEKEYLVPGIQEDAIPTSKPEANMPVHVIPDEEERVRPNKISDNSSELTYLKKVAYADTSSYYRILNVLKKQDTLYNPKTQKMHNTVIEGHYKVTGDTIVIPIVEHEYD